VASKFVKHFQHSMSAAVSAVFLPGADEAWASRVCQKKNHVQHREGSRCIGSGWTTHRPAILFILLAATTLCYNCEYELPEQFFVFS
jgi:hypothetical protein